MAPLGLSQNALVRALNVPPRRINEIVMAKRGHCEKCPTGQTIPTWGTHTKPRIYCARRARYGGHSCPCALLSTIKKTDPRGRGPDAVGGPG